MLAKTLISKTIVPLKTSDTGEFALGSMSDYNVNHFPIVNNQQLLELISDQDIMDSDIAEAIGSYSLALTQAHVQDDEHLYEVMRLLSEHQLTVIPVVDEDNNYVGVITQGDLIKFFADTGSFSEPGSIVVLEIVKSDYSMAEISQIVESEGGVILSSFITTNSDAFLIDVTIKINKPEVQHIIATFERFNYKIKASFLEAQFTDSLKERYDLLMPYLNI